MKNKEISKILVGSLTVTMVLNPFANNVDKVKAEVVSNEYLDSYTKEVNKDYIYLSDLDYDKNLSNTAWKEIMKDANTDGNKIKLLVDDEVVEYHKGMGAHATSTLVYDLNNYSNKYTRFIAHLGVDYAQKGKGNGVKFTISTSSDGKNWNVLKETGVITPDSNSEFVDIDISGAKYLKLYANDNGSNANDHAVYGDARILTKDYDISSEGMSDLLKVSDYDNILKAKTVEDNIKNNENLILKRALVNRVGYNNLQALYSSSDEYKEGIKFLLNNEKALKYFITNGEVTYDGSYLSSIKSFCSIYNKHKDELLDSSDDYFNLRLAVSISLAYSRDILVRFWIISDKEINAVTRYEIYQKLISSGLIDKGGDTTTYGKWSSEQFKKLPIPLMKWAVDTRMNDDEIEWLANYALSMKTEGSSDYLSAYNYISYTPGFDYTKDKYFDMNNYDDYNKKYHFSDYYSDFGTKNVYRLWMIFEEGAVCGGLAKTYANLSEVFGRPSSVVGQPGHAATITYGWNSKTNQYEWMIQNNISGWSKSGNEYSDRMLNWGNQSWCTGYSASYVALATDAIETQEAYDKYVQATMLNLLADSYDDLNTKEQIYRKALEIQGINLDSFEGLVEVYKANDEKTSKDYLDLAQMIVNAYTYYPLPMTDLLNYLSSGVTESQDVALLDLLRINALNKAKVATINDVKQPDIANEMAKFLLSDVSVDLASFSFDGENAGKIVINNKYENSEIRVRYSLDGQKTWKETSDHVISLTEEELASINETNDIVIGLVGTEATYTIDILAGKVVSASTLYNNDLENLLIGDTDYLQYSLDKGETWNDYVAGLDSDIRFTGNQVVYVRYKSHGTYMTGKSDRYTFHDDGTIDPQSSYLQLKHVSIYNYSSQNSDSINHAAINFIDGNINSAWHSTFSGEDYKFYSVEFDKVRYISKLTYMPGGSSNGRIKSGEIYISMDGESWEKVHTFSGLANNTKIQTIQLPQSVEAKYLKLVATETYGNSESEKNKFISGKMLNFYEDTTKEYKADVKIEYSTEDKTNGNVTAKLVLPSGCEADETEFLFNENGNHEFKYTDANGELNTIVAEVNWIDKAIPSIYEFDNTNLTN